MDLERLRLITLLSGFFIGVMRPISSQGLHVKKKIVPLKIFVLG